MGSCVSAAKGPSSTQLSAQQKQTNRFHNGLSNQLRSRAANARVVKKGRKKIHKGLIGLPSNFQVKRAKIPRNYMEMQDSVRMHEC
jgi:hypothetical protein